MGSSARPHAASVNMHSFLFFLNNYNASARGKGNIKKQTLATNYKCQEPPTHPRTLHRLSQSIKRLSISAAESGGQLRRAPPSSGNLYTRHDREGKKNKSEPRGHGAQQIGL